MRARRSFAGPAVAAAWSSRTWTRWTTTYPLARLAAPRALSASAVTRTSSGWAPRATVTDGLMPASSATAARTRALPSCLISAATSVELGTRTTAVARYAFVWTRDAMSAEAATATAVSAIRPLCRWNGRTENGTTGGRSAAPSTAMVVGGRCSTSHPEDVRPRHAAFTNEDGPAARGIDDRRRRSLAATTVDDESHRIVEQRSHFFRRRRRRTAMQVGARRRQWPDRSRQPAGDGMVRTSHTDGGRARSVPEGDVDARSPREDDRQASRPEP